MPAPRPSEPLAREPGGGGRSPVVFLVGAERSGTTLLRLMLDAHPQLAWANDFELAVDWMPEAGGWPELATYHDRLARDRIFQASGYEIDPELPYPELVRSFLAQRARAAGKPRVGATVHRHFDRLLRIWPRACFIHMLRDPRDVARSCVAMGWAGNVWVGVERWIEAEALWAELRPSLDEVRRLEIRYEALIAQPEELLGRICEFIGVGFDPAMLSYPERTRYTRPDPSLVEQWRRALSPTEVRLVESRAGAMLEQCGYAASGLSPLEVSRGMALRLRAQDRWARWRNAVRLYGWRLWLGEAFARRLGLRATQRRLERRMNAIIQSNLR